MASVAEPSITEVRVRFAETDAQGVAHNSAYLVWFEIAEEQNVFPMMPAGKGLSDLIENWGGADE